MTEKLPDLGVHNEGQQYEYYRVATNYFFILLEVKNSYFLFGMIFELEKKK